MRNLRLFLAVGAIAVPAVALSACGNSVPGNAVAKVGDDSITKTQFNHWMQVAAISSQGALPGQKKTAVQVPQPPNFAECVAQKQKTAPKPAKGQPKPTTAQFKAQCEQEYKGLRDQVLQFLISAEWIQGEASDQGVKVSDSEVDKQFQQTKKQSFPKEKDYKKFLKDSGMSQSDILFRVKLDTLSNKLREKVTKGKDKVTDAQVTDYYNKNKQRFAQPERRDLRIVLTKTKPKALQAKQAIQSGTDFKSVAKKYSIDQASKAQGGVLLAVAKGQQEKALDTAIFKAKKGQLNGPIKTQFGYYVFKVQKITPATQQSLKQAKETIKQLLASQNQQKALDSFVKDFRKKWKDKTNCRKDFVTQDCKNAPKPKKTTSTPPGAIPQPTAPNGQ
ncbi:MAG TPA: peptidyl-prolyl cis-trans isomerase [Solirubrobacteraceae bacterium]|jgi:foldase protein PrsA